MNYRFIDHENNVTKSVIFSIIKGMTAFCYIICFLTIYITLIVNGEILLTTVQNFYHRIYPFGLRKEKRIGLTLTFIQLCSHLCLNIIYEFLSNQSFSFYNMPQTVALISIEVIQSSIVPLIGYQSLIISDYLESSLKDFSPIKLHFIYQKLCLIKHHIIKINKLISPIILVLCFS